MAHNPLHKNPNPIVTKTTVRPFGKKVFGKPTVSRSGNTITTTTPYKQTRSSSGVTYQDAYAKAGGQSGTSMSFSGFKKAAIDYNTRTGSVVATRKVNPVSAVSSLKPVGIKPMGSMPKPNPIIPIATGPSPITNPKVKVQKVSKPKKKRKPFRPLGRKPFQPGGTISNITRGIGYAAGDVGRTAGNVAVGAVTLPFKALGSIFKGGCGRGKCNPMAKNIFGQRKKMRR